ncbi:MAG TPA: ABC transporter substrate-binding protein [Candidatus Binatia bacterium]|nr:ABC transporter substrate-binding protein [Candidatus Binatia bacterium]
MSKFARIAALLCAAALMGQTNAPVTIRLSASPVDDVMPVLYAQRAGLFRQAGLNVTMDRANSGAAISAAVAGGSVDIGKGNIVSIVAGHARGIPLVLVAPAAIYDPKAPDAALLVAASSNLRTAGDLAGKTVGTPALNDLNSMATLAWMEANKADPHSISFVEIPFPALDAALETGRVQAIAQVKPFISDAVDSGKARVLGLTYSAVASRFLESAWFASTDYVAKNKDVVAKFQRIVAQASAYTNAHQSETVDLLATWAGIDPQRAARVPRIVTGITLQARDIQPVIDIAAKYNVIPKPFDAREIMAQ